MSLKQVTDRLRQVILEHNHGFANVPIRELTPCPNDETNDWHLLWMINEIQTSETMGLLQCHRWLAFIQGVMVCKHYTTVAIEREETRELL